MADRKRSDLEEMRDLLRAAMVGAEGNELAALVREMRQVLKELDEVTTPEVSGVDELKRRRRDKLAAAVPDGTDDRELGGR